MLISDARGVVEKDITLPEAVSRARALVETRGQTLYAWDESDGTSGLTVAPLALAPARQYRQVLNYLLGRRQRTVVSAEDESALIGLADGYYGCMTLTEQAEADAWWANYQQPTSRTPSAPRTIMAAATDLVSVATDRQAPDLLQALAGALRERGAAALDIHTYAPRSGAARRAIAAGADPAPLLMDVSECGTFQQVSLEDFQLSRGENLVRCNDEVLAVGSKVTMATGEARHLLLLDFSVAPSAEAQAELVHFLAYAGWQGWLLCSGASYHFMGAELMELADWRRAMARAQLIPGIDVRYMAHSMFNDLGGLRFTACFVKPRVPYMVASLGGGAR